MAYLGIVCLLVASMIGISYVLGERHSEPRTGEPYESGAVSTGTARIRLSVKFYLVALFFVVFDVESIYIFAYAIAFRHLGWVAYLEVIFFIGVLVAAWVYLWRLGALDWGTVRLQRERRKQQRIMERNMQKESPSE